MTEPQISFLSKTKGLNDHRPTGLSRPPLPLIEPALPDATSLLPLRETTYTAFSLVVGAAMVIGSTALVDLNDAVQHRLRPSAIVASVALIAMSVAVATIVRTRAESFVLDGDDTGLLIKHRSKHPGSLAWKDIDRFVVFRATKELNRIAAITPARAVEIKVPTLGCVHPLLREDEAGAVVAELNLRLNGQRLAAPRIEARDHRRWLALSMCGAVAFFAVAAAGEIGSANRSNEIRARSKSVAARVLDSSRVGNRDSVVIMLPDNYGQHTVDLENPSIDYRPGDTVEVSIDPTQTDAVWVDDQVRWPPGTRDLSTTAVTTKALLWISAFVLTGCAYAAHRGRANPQLVAHRTRASR